MAVWQIENKTEGAVNALYWGTSEDGGKRWSQTTRVSTGIAPFFKNNTFLIAYFSPHGTTWRA